MSISTDHLFFSYDGINPILEDISIQVDEGQFVGIFGPNGGGKTTLLKLLLGRLRPQKGQVHLLGQAPSEVSEQIGYVPQMGRFDKAFPISVLEVVLQGCLAKDRGWVKFSQQSRKKALEALEKVELASIAHQPFGSLSGGQTQRTLIARALASDPKILLLDEATVGVDPDALGKFFKLLVELKKSMTIVFVTHDLKEILKEMDVLYCINQQATKFTTSQVCEHFAMGLYHPKLDGDHH